MDFDWYDNQAADLEKKMRDKFSDGRTRWVVYRKEDLADNLEDFYIYSSRMFRIECLIPALNWKGCHSLAVEALALAENRGDLDVLLNIIARGVMGCLVRDLLGNAD